MSKYKYFLRYSPYTQRVKDWVSQSTFNWVEGHPERITINFYTVHKYETNGFFGFRKREYDQQHWANDNQRTVPRQSNETKSSWLARVENIAKEGVKDLDRMSLTQQTVNKMNKETGEKE